MKKISTNEMKKRYLVVAVDAKKNTKFFSLKGFDLKSKAKEFASKMREESDKGIRVFDLKIATYQNRNIILN